MGGIKDVFIRNKPMHLNPFNEDVVKDDFNVNDLRSYAMLIKQ